MVFHRYQTARFAYPIWIVVISKQRLVALPLNFILISFYISGSSPSAG